MCFLKLVRLEWSRSMGLESKTHKSLWDEDVTVNSFHHFAFAWLFMKHFPLTFQESWKAGVLASTLQVRRPRQTPGPELSPHSGP